MFNKENSIHFGFFGLHCILPALLLIFPAYAEVKGTNPEIINLHPAGRAPLGDGKFSDQNATITVYLPEKPNGAAIVICPGGGYARVVDVPEGHNVAKWLNQHGIAGIVLNYRLPKGNRHLPLADAQRAIRTVRSMAKKWNCDPTRVGIMGFSAGGHLASTASTHFDSGETKASDPIQCLSSRPDFTILIYPVITMLKPHCHEGSKNNLLGKNASEDLLNLYSNEKQVTAQTPPAFLAHAQDDKLVPPVNSHMYHDALLARQVPSRYIKIAKGGHGFHNYKGDAWETWKTESLMWLADIKMIQAPGATGQAQQGKNKTSAKH